jgi:predicted site-specific integrase-resolvase
MTDYTSQDNRLEPEKLLTTAEVADAFGVHLKTVGRWAQGGLLEHIRTPTGFYRFRSAYIRGILNGGKS